jgi:hypothetical protein
MQASFSVTVPSAFFWGYGVEMLDPDGYIVRLWDERSMKENAET